jgi:hypothetical protein
MKTQLPLATAAALLCGSGLIANAGVVAVSPFVGSLTETWESYAGGVWQPSPLSIMGGGASLSAAGILTSTSGTHDAGSSGHRFIAPEGVMHAYVHAAGAGAMRIFDLSFATPVTQFGAYFGGFTGSGWADPGSFRVTFKDGLGGVLDTVTFTYSHAATYDGLFDWHGWASSVPVAAIQVDRVGPTDVGWLVIDALQASVPEPASVAVVAGLGLIGLAVRRRMAGSRA